MGEGVAEFGDLGVEGGEREGGEGGGEGGSCYGDCCRG